MISKKMNGGIMEQNQNINIPDSYLMGEMFGVFSLCIHCSHPIHKIETSSESIWLHQETGKYYCPVNTPSLIPCYARPKRIYE
jgi:hypothetical protein